ncbi:MAG TPA: hypothetical protein VJ790_20980, partial [Dongiaceae bacterium]|nr:hypothetical protein [Dongiaceae bacterium]
MFADRMVATPSSFRTSGYSASIRTSDLVSCAGMLSFAQCSGSRSQLPSNQLTEVPGGEVLGIYQESNFDRYSGHK